VNLRPASTDDSEALARAHAAAFDGGWSAADIAALMTASGSFAILAETPEGEVTGFILGRALGGEAEILTLAVAPAARRRGLARALVEALALQARELHAKALFLEVAADNEGAIGLYHAAGFERVGLRRAYYARPGAHRLDAMVMRRPLNS
jgi:ribosomal-protein-alanine N-acetyltransferase